VRKQNLASSLVLILFSCVICYYAIQTRVGIPTNPGPGFFPLMIGIGLLLLSLILFFQAYKNPRSSDQEQRRGKTRWWAIILLAISVVIYCLILETLGYLISTLLLTLFIFRAIEPQRWRIVIIGGLGSTLFSYLLFQVWLKIDLPIGIWGF
jgi:putative tricarboxylic transport membrane protein